MPSELWILRPGWRGCDVARAEIRLNDSYEFQESRVSRSVNGVSGKTYTPTDTHTHWYKHPHQTRLQVSIGNVTAFAFAQLVLCLFCVGFGSLFVSRGVHSLPLFPLHAFVHSHWRGSCAEGSLMRLFGRGMCSVKPRYMCALHVPGRALPYWYTFYAKYGARGAEGWRDWRMKHMDTGRGSPWLLVLWEVAPQTDGKHWDKSNVDVLNNKQV